MALFLAYDLVHRFQVAAAGAAHGSFLLLRVRVEVALYVEVIADAIKGNRDPIPGPAEARFARAIGLLQVVDRRVAVRFEALQGPGDQDDVSQRRLAPYGFIDTLQHDGEPAGVHPVAVLAVPVVGLVEGLKDLDILMKEVDDGTKVVDILVDPIVLYVVLGWWLSEPVARPPGR